MKTTQETGSKDKGTVKPERRLLVIGILFIAAFIITAALVFSSVIQSVDSGLAQALNNSPPDGAFSALMILVSDFGQYRFWIPVVLIMLLLGDRNTKLLAFELAALLLISTVSGDIAKMIF